MGRRKAILSFGRYDSQRQIHYLRNLCKLRGQKLAKTLVDEKVIIKPDEKEPRALNFVSTWHAACAFCAVISPTIIGTIVCITWPVVATRRFNAEIQASIQTGFAIGSYIVTAGAIIVALVTFSATTYERAAQDSIQGRIIKVVEGDELLQEDTDTRRTFTDGLTDGVRRTHRTRQKRDSGLQRALPLNSFPSVSATVESEGSARSTRTLVNVQPDVQADVHTDVQTDIVADVAARNQAKKKAGRPGRAPAEVRFKDPVEDQPRPSQPSRRWDEENQISEPPSAHVRPDSDAAQP